MLRLVHPPPSAGQGTDLPRRRKGAKPRPLFLTHEEARLTRTALKNAARAFGSLECLGAVMGLSAKTLRHASNPKRSLSGTFAIRLAKAAGASVEAILTGALNAAGRCPTCGHRAGDGRLVAAGGAS